MLHLLWAIALSLVTSQTDLSVCNNCCVEHFIGIFDNPGGQRDDATERCELGCDEGSFQFGLECVSGEVIDPDCQVGINFRTNGEHSFIDEVGDPINQFCVGNGVLSVSASPTQEPTPRERAPVAFDDEVPEPEESESSIPILPIALGAVGGCVLVVGAILFLIIPRPKNDFDKGLTENEFAKIQEETRSVGTATILHKQAVQREKFAGKIIKYKVIQAFEAEAEDELSLKVGEFVEGVTPVDEEWWIVRRVDSDEEGLVPLAYLEEHEVINLVETEKADDPNDELPGLSQPGITGNQRPPNAGFVEEPLDF